MTQPSSRAPQKSVRQAASVCCLFEEKVLLVQRAHSPSKDLWSFPGGKSQDLESPEETARRELEEETGLRAVRLEFVGIEPIRGDEREFDIYVFKCETFKGEAQPGSDAKSLCWYSKQEALTLSLAPSIDGYLRRFLP